MLQAALAVIKKESHYDFFLELGKICWVVEGSS